MAQSTIAIIVLLVALVLYAIPKIPMSVTTILAMLAMPFFGIIDYSKAFAGFANSATLLVAGMMVIGQACFTSGLADRFGNVLYRFAGKGDRVFAPILFTVVVILSAFLNGGMVAAVFIPIIDTIAAKSGGRITRKQCYFPMAVGTIVGNNLTTVSASSTITGIGVLTGAGYDTMPVFAPTAINLMPALVCIVLFALVGPKMQARCFNFEEIPAEIPVSVNAAEKEYKTWKIVLSGVVLVVVIAAMVMGANFGACALLGSALLIVTGCIGEKAAFRAINWPVIIIIAGALGFSSGLTASGAGGIIATFVLDLFGPLGQSPWAMCIALFIIAQLLSDVMSDNATVALLVPIGIALSIELNANVLPFVIAVCSGAKVAICTPISVAPMTMVQMVGYRFKDYLFMGGLVNVIHIIGVAIMLKVVYFM